jgi:hypothetical protein
MRPLPDKTNAVLVHGKKNEQEDMGIASQCLMTWQGTNHLPPNAAPHENHHLDLAITLPGKQARVCFPRFPPFS